MFDITKLQMKKHGKGQIEKYLFSSFDEWDVFKDSLGDNRFGIHDNDWIEPDRIPFIMLVFYDGAGWHNMEFVYPDEFPTLGIIAPDEKTEKEWEDRMNAPWR